ncbi:unnamed protein product [uncultured bacterium]|nr:unnamed protein product [uncultured bacterium]
MIGEHGQPMQSRERETTPKKKNGKVFIVMAHWGEVDILEDYLSRKKV